MDLKFSWTGPRFMEMGYFGGLHKKKIFSGGHAPGPL